MYNPRDLPPDRVNLLDVSFIEELYSYQTYLYSIYFIYYVKNSDN